METIYPGEPGEWIEFEMKSGLEELRGLATKMKGKNIGIKVIGNFSILSHAGEILRIAKVPSVRIPI